MLSRYTMKRGAPVSQLPAGIRQDTRKHTRHPLRPTQELVAAYLAQPGDKAWTEFEESYMALIAARFEEDRAPFDRLASLASEQDVWLGCSCPTATNPRPDRCHTILALRFMRSSYPDLNVRIPAGQR